MLSAPPDLLRPGEGGAAILPIVGPESFMLLEEDEHLSGRRAVNPALHRRMAEEHATLIAEVAERQMALWPRGTPIALLPRLRALTLEVILRLIFGRLTRVDVSVLRARLLTMMEINGTPALTEEFLRRGPIGRRLWRRFLRNRAAVDELIVAHIQERMRAGGDETGDVLGLLLAARNVDGSPMSVAQVRDNIMSVVLAGHETTASQLAWAFQLLTHNPNAMRRLTAEIDARGDGPYVTATIQEVLRHRPVFLFTIPRAVARPVEIGGWTYRPPAHLLGCIYLMHHDPASVDEPHRFVPERYLTTGPGPTTWLPWGGGRKVCPGRHLAMLEMRTVLRMVLAELDVRPAERTMERARWRGVIVTPHRGGRVILHNRRDTAAVRRPPRSCNAALATCPGTNVRATD